MESRASQQHITVLKEEAVEALNLERDSVVVDATLGAGGHTREILAHLSEAGQLVSIDADETAISAFGKAGKNHALVCGNFRDLPDIMTQEEISGVDGILADLGWRQEQFSDGGKGFSFASDDPLLMTFGNSTKYHFTAADIVNDWEEAVLADIIFGYGEERLARRIARAIVEKREMQPFTTAAELAALIQEVVPTRANTKIHPATKTFQALRIAVNDELEVLKAFISVSINALNPGGRLAIISFHSLEDRIVKHTFRTAAHDQVGDVVTKKPVMPDFEEVAKNPRSRSAKLRVFEKS